MPFAGVLATVALLAASAPAAAGHTGDEPLPIVFVHGSAGSGAEYGVERLNLVGHSLGTFVSGNYLALPARTAKIAHFVGIDGGMLRIWEVNSATGHRKYATPLATVTLGPTGEWGPFTVNGQQHYEFDLQRPDSSPVGNLYYQPFIRDDYWVRLPSALPNSGTIVNTVTGPDHAAAVVLRYRE